MLRGLFDNDSLFGQIMIRCWAIIICNICFVITALPIVTAGAGWAAMDFALMNTLKNKNTAAPFRDFSVYHQFQAGYDQLGFKPCASGLPCNGLVLVQTVWRIF